MLPPRPPRSFVAGVVWFPAGFQLLLDQRWYCCGQELPRLQLERRVKERKCNALRPAAASCCRQSEPASPGEEGSLFVARSGPGCQHGPQGLCAPPAARCGRAVQGRARLLVREASSRQSCETAPCLPRWRRPSGWSYRGGKEEGGRKKRLESKAVEVCWQRRERELRRGCR